MWSGGARCDESRRFRLVLAGLGVAGFGSAVVVWHGVFGSGVFGSGVDGPGLAVGVWQG